MSNPYFTASGTPAAQTRGISSNQRTEFTSIQSGFDKLPSLNNLYANGGNFAVDTGTSGALAVTISVNVTSLFEGMEVVVKTKFSCPGASIIIVTGSAAFASTSIVRNDGSALQSNDWAANDYLQLRYNATSGSFQMERQVSTSPTSGLPTTGGTMTGQIKYAKGAAVVAAATVNLDAATGNDFHMTGNTTITAFTIAAGQLLKVIVDGTPLITYNATSLKVPGLANIQAAAGDTFWIMGDGSGNSIITDYTYANGNVATSAQIKTGTDVLKSLTPAAALTALGFTAYFQSTDQTITAAGLLTIAHGLGRTPVSVQPLLKNVTADSGYVIGDITLVSLEKGGASQGVSLTWDATNIFVRFGSTAANTFSITNKTTGASGSITNTNWSFLLRAWA